MVGWDLPGHGTSAPATGPFTVAELAEGVLGLAGDRPFHYAGDSVGGAVGLQLLLDRPTGSPAPPCSAPAPGSAPRRAGRSGPRWSGPRAPRGRAAAAQSWFGPGFVEREPGVAGACWTPGRHRRRPYAWVCEALAGFDVTGRLGEIRSPVLAVAGGYDTRTPVEGLRAIATASPTARLVVLDGVAHLAPAEAPAATAALIVGYLLRRPLPGRSGMTLADTCVRDAGKAVRREVLGDAHVDRATASATDLTRDFQELITEYAWGSIWTRPGLDRRSRSLITLTALVARGHHEELAHAPARRPHQRPDRRRDQGGAAADRDLLRGAGRQHRVPHRPAACCEDEPSSDEP